MWFFFTKAKPSLDLHADTREPGRVPRKARKGFQPIKYFPRCKNCLDLYPGRQQKDCIHVIQERSHSLSLEEVFQSSRNGCAGCAVLEAILTPYREDVRENSQLRPYHLPQGRALVVEVDGVGTSISLNVFTSSSWNRRCPWNTIAACSHISGDTGSDQAVIQVRNWLEHCIRYHEDCGASRQDYLPTRVLEILGPKSTRLRITESLPGRYACLSHCWGSASLIQTTRSNIASFQEQIPWDDLPRSFQEAVSFTNRLGLRYIWIDSLCIIQDDINDWRHEGSKMADIYQNSHITLATSILSDSSGSCFVKSPTDSLSRIFTFTRRAGESNQYDIRLRDCSDIDVLSDVTDGRGTLLPITGWASPQNFQKEEYEICVRKPLKHGNPLEGEDNGHLPLLRRGWFFQEHLLSPRVVHFASNELYWECKRRITCECSELQTDFPRTKLDLATVRPSIRWHRIVEEYTTKDLTFSSDIFPALQGLAKQIQSEIDSEYHAGLWEDHLLRDLLWFSPTTSERPSQWRAPTWSWASIMGSVKYPDSRNNSYQVFWRRPAIVERVWTEPVGTDPMGELKAGGLRLTGECITASLIQEAITNTQSTRRKYWRLSIIGQDWGLYLDKSSAFYPDYCYEAESTHHVANDTLVRIMRIFEVMRIVDTYAGPSRRNYICLVFRCVDATKDVYERIGYVQMDNVSERDDVFRYVGKEMSLNVV